MLVVVAVVKVVPEVQELVEDDAVEDDFIGFSWFSCRSARTA